MAWHGVVWAFLCRYIRIALTFSIEESETAEDRQPHGWYSVDLKHGAAQGFSGPGVCEAWEYVCVLVMCSMCALRGCARFFVRLKPSQTRCRLPK